LSRAPRGARRRGFPVFLLLGALAIRCGPTSDERRVTIYELRSEPHERNVARIRELLGDSQRDVRATALDALVGLEVPDAEGLAREALRDEDSFVRVTAVRLLGDLGDPESAHALAERLIHDGDPVVRQRAAEALGVLGGEVSFEGLAAGLADPAERVRVACIESLAGQDPGRAAQTLSRLVVEDASWQVRAQAARALGLSGDPAVVPALEAALGDPNEYVRAAAANALGLRARDGAIRPSAPVTGPS
jgi:HEAT repeat protein